MVNPKKDMDAVSFIGNYMILQGPLVEQLVAATEEDDLGDLDRARELAHKLADVVIDEMGKVKNIEAILAVQCVLSSLCEMGVEQSGLKDVVAKVLAARHTPEGEA